jgi:hypothetical protein
MQTETTMIPSPIALWLVGRCTFQSEEEKQALSERRRS